MSSFHKQVTVHYTAEQMYDLVNDIDAYSTIQKQISMLGLILYFNERARQIIKAGAPIRVIHSLSVVDTLIRMKTQVANNKLEMLDEIHKTIDEQMTQLEADYK